MTALPPKPTHNFFPLRFSPPVVVTEAERLKMIEIAAYHKAESRNFAPGHEIADWAAAESEVTARLADLLRFTGINI